MKSARSICMFVLLALLVGGGAERRASSAPSQSRPPSASSLLQMPLRFEPNRGQMDERVRFLARGHGYELYLTTEGATVALKRSSGETRAARRPPVRAPNRAKGARDLEQAVVSMRLAGGRLDVEPAGSQVLPGTTNYFIGDDPSRWKAGVEGYARVRYVGVLPGVDVVYYANGERRLEYDLVLAPGTDPNDVAVTFDGARSLTIDGDGAAVLELRADAEIVLPAPAAYQAGHDGQREPVAVRYERREGALAFVVGRFDRRRALVIDPTLVYSTYLGGSAYDYASAIAVNSQGQAYLAGFTASTDFPLAGAYQGTNARGMDAFVTKLNPSGSALVYSTYLGGSSYDYATAIAIDSANEPCVAGYTQSTNFPTASPYQAGLGAAGAENAFVATLDVFGSTLTRSTYLGGGASDYASAIAVNSAREVFVAGYTSSTNFPTASAYQGNSGGGYDAFVTKFSPLPALVSVPAMGRHLVWLAALLLIAGGRLAASRRGRAGAVHPR